MIFPPVACFRASHPKDSIGLPTKGLLRCGISIQLMSQRQGSRDD